MSKDKLKNAKERATARSLLPLVALGGGLAATPAAALELGELTVHSNLGQPLRASIAYALAPSEMLSNTCVSISAGPTTSGLPGIGPSSIRITERVIMISGRSAIREPMLATRVTIDCPYTPNLSREYMLLVDPVDIANARASAPLVRAPVAQSEPAPVARPAPAARPEPAPAARSEPAPVARPAPASRSATTTPARRAPVNTAPIGQSTRYQVQPGDSLSEIVARIENRSMKLWPAVNRVFAANPDAFIDNDPNKLKAGSWLTIPSLDGTAPVVNAATPEPVSSPAETPVPAADTSASAEEPVSASDSAVFVETGRAAEEPVVSDGTADLMPGDAVADFPAAQNDAPVAQVDVPGTQVNENIVIPDTELEGPQTTSSSPNVPTAIVSTRTRGESTSLLVWLIGGGLALILALLVFGRRARERFGADPAAQASPYADDRYADDPVAPASDVDSDAAMLVESAMHFDIDDDSPTDENLALDADLLEGTGLEGTETHAAHDFGFAETTSLDIELPFEPEKPVEDSVSMIEPISGDMSVESILDSEILPQLDDDDDMTIGGDTIETVRMPMDEYDTAAPLHEASESLDLDEATAVTIEQEMALSILEQDYEDELSATQLLNKEIERAAAQLTRDLDPVDATAETTELRLATVTELDATAELRKKDADETSEFEASFDPDDTNALTVSMPDDEETNRMPVANDDDTVEMDIESGKVDTRKR